jgi:hypothetical protein
MQADVTYDVWMNLHTLMRMPDGQFDGRRQPAGLR